MSGKKFGPGAYATHITVERMGDRIHVYTKCARRRQATVRVGPTVQYPVSADRGTILSAVGELVARSHPQGQGRA